MTWPRLGLYGAVLVFLIGCSSKLCWQTFALTMLCCVMLCYAVPQIELARLEMKDKSFPRAIEVLEAALDMATTKFGQETAEACESTHPAAFPLILPYSTLLSMAWRRSCSLLRSFRRFFL